MLADPRFSQTNRMTQDTDPRTQALDLFDLTQASIQDLIEDLKREHALDNDDDSAPPRAVQVAGLTLAESIRLIRMGTRTEIAEASDELSQLLITSAGERLGQNQPEAYRLLSGAAVALGAATSASSKGGAQMVMRSWKGKAKEVVKLLLDAPGEQAQRSYLREKVGITDHSHFSHLLSDLEAARLIARVRTGKEVLVRLGPTGRTDQVRDELSPGRPIFPHGFRRWKIEGIDRASERNHPGPPHLRLVPQVEAAGLAAVVENEVFTPAGNTSTSSLSQVTSMNRPDVEADKPNDELFGEAMYAADLPSLARQTSTH